MKITILNETKSYRIELGNRLLYVGALDRECDIYDAEMLLWNFYKKGNWKRI